MAQNNLVVVGIDVAKDKVDACIRSLSQTQMFPSAPEGRRKLIAWLRRNKVGKAVMEASGGYERDWAKALREAGFAVRIVDPKRVRSFARSAGRSAKNDSIDAEMIAWFAETFEEAACQAYDAEREKLGQIVYARQALIDVQTELLEVPSVVVADFAKLELLHSIQRIHRQFVDDLYIPGHRKVGQLRFEESMKLTGRQRVPRRENNPRFEIVFAQWRVHPVRRSGSDFGMLHDRSFYLHA